MLRDPLLGLRTLRSSYSLVAAVVASPRLASPLCIRNEDVY